MTNRLPCARSVTGPASYRRSTSQSARKRSGLAHGSRTSPVRIASDCRSRARSRTSNRGAARRAGTLLRARPPGADTAARCRKRFRTRQSLELLRPS
eukprot:409465-Prymnesium_polylepis.1